MITLDDGVSIEIVKVVASSGGTGSGFLTIENRGRGMEGTTSANFHNGTRVEARITAGTLSSFETDSDMQYYVPFGTSFVGSNLTTILSDYLTTATQSATLSNYVLKSYLSSNYTKTIDLSATYLPAIDLAGHISDALTTYNSGTLASTYALKASPTFTGTPTAPTAVSTSNDLTLANTAFVYDAIRGHVPGKLLAFTKITATRAFSPDSSTTTMIVTLVGGGAGGGGANNSVRVGGMAGGVLTFTYSGIMPTSILASIGVGGLAGVTPTGYAGNGGATTFVGDGISFSAPGGLAWTEAGWGPNATDGESCIGIGGQHGNTGPGGNAADNSGAGGGGSQSNLTGGVGGSGIIYVWEYS
jgi:hypothetical protein